MDEFGLINKYFAPIGNQENSLGLLDDAAIIPFNDEYDYILTKDVISEGSHFIPGTDPKLIAQKLLRVNLSDLAAMGAKPLYYLLGVFFKPETSPEFIERFSTGLREDSKEFDLVLLGGDTIVQNSGVYHFSLTAIGVVPKGKALLRSGAKLGDNIYVSGAVGDGYLGLLALQDKIKVSSEIRDKLAEKYFLPTPRVELGKALIGIANSAIDVSDGVFQDLSHIMDASGLGANVYLEQIPISESARSLGLEKQSFINFGDDYELVFTAPSSSHDQIQEIATKLGVKLTKIGEVVEGRDVKLFDNNGAEILVTGGFKHFE